jgi:hypothetical protein
MQSFTYKNFLTLAITVGLLTSFGHRTYAAGDAKAATSVPALEHINFPKISDLTAKQAAVSALIVVTIAAIWSFYHKTTQPKRVYPRDNSAGEILSYIWNEIIVGQEEKPERATRVEVDLENPTILNIKYESVDPRGIVGITHAYAKDVIIPTLTAVLIFNTYKKQIVEALTELSKVVTDPAVITHVVKEAPKA